MGCLCAVPAELIRTVSVALCCVQLWATLAHCFNPPTGSTSISTRMKDFYASMLAPFDKVRGVHTGWGSL
jgi:hypothetical protein